MIFSVIVPVYNTELKILEHCINSIICQKFDDYELIIVDDGSEKKIAYACDMLARQNNRIKVIHQENKGLPSARNTGISVAKGEWLIHIDSDDWIKPGMFEMLFRTVQKKTYDIVVFGYESVIENRISEHTLKNIKLFQDDYQTIKVEFLRGIMRATHTFDNLALNTSWGKAFRRNFIKKIGITFNEELRRAQDVIYNLEVFSRAESVGFMEGIYYVYRADNNSLSRGYNPKTYERITKTAQCCVQFVNSYPESEKLISASYCFVRSCFTSIVRTDFLNSENIQSKSIRRERFKNILNKEPYQTAFKINNLRHTRLSSDIEDILISLKAFGLLSLYKKLYEELKAIFK